MTQLKGFAFLVIAAFSIDLAAFDGVYRHALGRQMHHVTYQFTQMHWTGGFFGS